MVVVHLLCDVFRPPRLVQRDDNEAPAAADLNNDGQKLWIDGAIVGVVRVPGDLHLFVFQKITFKFLKWYL